MEILAVAGKELPAFAVPDQFAFIGKTEFLKNELMFVALGYTTTSLLGVPEKSLTPGVGLMGLRVHALNGNEFHWFLPLLM
jgi:hypothetical protein